MCGNPQLKMSVAACVDTFIEERNTLAYDGKRIPGANEEATCKDECLKNTECVGFDFDNDNKA